MRTFQRSLVTVLIVTGLLSVRGTLLAAEGPYRLANEITVGGEGGWDYLSVDAAARRLYVTQATNGRSNSATVFDAATGEVRATIALNGKPEFAVVDVKAGRIYNNLEDKNAVAVIDTAKHEVMATWPIAPGESATGLAIDLEHHRLFLGCGNDLYLAAEFAPGPSGPEGKPGRPQVVPGSFKVVVYEMIGPPKR